MRAKTDSVKRDAVGVVGSVIGVHSSSEETVLRVAKSGWGEVYLNSSNIQI